jgi:hypothetical protein
MANKPGARNWNDVQMVIAVISMTLTLGFWNLFAGPDRVTAEKRAKEAAAVMPAAESPSVVVAPTPMGNGTIYLGGSAPQSVIVQSRGGGGGGGGAVTSTSSS